MIYLHHPALLRLARTSPANKARGGQRARPPASPSGEMGNLKNAAARDSDLCFFQGGRPGLTPYTDKHRPLHLFNRRYLFKALAWQVALGMGNDSPPPALSTEHRFHRVLSPRSIEWSRPQSSPLPRRPPPSHARRVSQALWKT